MNNRTFRALLLGGATILGGLGASAYGQSLTVDPYRPYYSSFRATANPIYPPPPSFPNQSRFARGPLTGPAGANQFSGGGLGGPVVVDEPNDGFGGMPGSRYDSAFRYYDSMFGRDYVPNRDIDGRFFENKQKRDELYLEALSTKDRRKRAALLRQVDELRLRSAREVDANSRNRAGASSGRSAASSSGGTRGSTSAPFSRSSGAGRGGAAVRGSGNEAVPTRSRNPLLDYLPPTLESVGPSPSDILERSRALPSGSTDELFEPPANR